MNASGHIRVFVLGGALAATVCTGFFDADLYGRGGRRYLNLVYSHRPSHEHPHNDYDTTCLIENNVAVVSSSSTVSASRLNISGIWSVSG